MKLNNLESEVLFDDIPKLYDAKNKVFVTHLHHLDEMIAPKKFPKILTTQVLAEKMKNHFAKRNIQCDKFFILEPYRVYEIKLSTGTIIKVSVCDGNDYSNNLMVLIRKNNKENFIYINMFAQIRAGILNRTFTSWVQKGIDELYVNLKEADPQNNADADPIHDDFQKIIAKLTLNQRQKIHILIPLFGFENFIAELLKRFPNLVSLSGDHEIAMANSMKEFKLCTSPEEARIFVVKRFTNYDINICKMSLVDTKIPHVEKLSWSPLPHERELKLFVRLIKPKRLVGIVNIHTMARQVPKYLRDLVNELQPVNKAGYGGGQGRPVSYAAAAVEKALQSNLSYKSGINQSRTSPGKTTAKKPPSYVRCVQTLNYVDQNSEASDD